MLPQSFALWDRITQTHPTHLLKSQGGSLTSPTEILGDHLQEEGGHRHAPQDHLQEEEEVEAEGVVEEEAEAVEEHSHCQDTHLPSQLKSF